MSRIPKREDADEELPARRRRKRPNGRRLDLIPAGQPIYAVGRFWCRCRPVWRWVVWSSPTDIRGPRLTYKAWLSVKEPIAGGNAYDEDEAHELAKQQAPNAIAVSQHYAWSPRRECAGRDHFLEEARSIGIAPEAYFARMDEARDRRIATDRAERGMAEPPRASNVVDLFAWRQSKAEARNEALALELVALSLRHALEHGRRAGLDAMQVLERLRRLCGA